MSRRTPEQEVAHQMQKMKELGITISGTPALARTDNSFPADHPFGIITEAAKAAGIYYEKDGK